MKTILLGSAIFCLALTGFSQRKQTDLEFDGLRGKVESLQNSSTYFGTKDKPEKSPKRRYGRIRFYGLDGNITEELDSDAGIKYLYEFVDGFLSMKEVVVDEKKAANIMRGRLIGNAEDMEKPLKTIKPDERFTTRFDSEYDNSGRRKVRRIFFSDGKMDSITHYIYNSAGLLETEIYNSYGNKWSYFNAYDTSGNLKEMTMKRSDVRGVIDMINRTKYSNYKFDENGNWIERRYTYQSEDSGSSTISEGVDYRDINYSFQKKPKRKQERSLNK